jgi:ABC-type glycerol-3-phosphate transport system permease component
MIIPGLASAFAIFTMRQFMYSIPDELLDAARIDGASEFQIFIKIVLPMSVPALTTVTIFTFFAEWNNFLWPMIMIRSKEMYTLPLSLMLLESRAPRNVDYPVVFAASVLATIPTLLIFFLLQRHFTGDDAAAGALKF